MSTIAIIGAGHGIGLALTREALARGHHVVATSRTPETATELTLLAAKTNALTIQALEVTDEDSLARFTEAVSQPVDVLIANAGILIGRGGIEDPAHSFEAWKDVLITNVIGKFMVTRSLLPQIRRGTEKKIALISSIMASSTRAQGNAYSYRASTAAVLNMGLNMATELKPEGIAVGIYHPGWVRTRMGGEEADISPEESAHGLLDRIGALSLESCNPTLRTGGGRDMVGLGGMWRDGGWTSRKPPSSGVSGVVAGGGGAWRGQRQIEVVATDGFVVGSRRGDAGRAAKFL